MVEKAAGRSLADTDDPWIGDPRLAALVSPHLDLDTVVYGVEGASWPVAVVDWSSVVAIPAGSDHASRLGQN